MAEKPQILQLTPSEELKFTGPFDDKVITLLTLQNLTNKTVLFNIKTTAPRNYCVRPNNGEIVPYGQEDIEVILQPTDEAKLAEYQKHKFMIQSMILSDNIPTPENISYAIRTAPKANVTDFKLKCVFVDKPEFAEEDSTLVQQNDSTIGAAGIRHRKN